MEPLRSNVWSAETLARGVRHTNLQPEQLLAWQSMSDEALHHELEDWRLLPALYNILYCLAA